MIRPYRPADAAAVDALAVQAFTQYSADCEDWPGLRARLGQMSTLAKVGELIVAESAGSLLGAVAYLPPGAPRADFFEPGWAVMRLLVVAPSARRRGLGRSLAEACLDRARRDGAASIALHSSEIMRAALKLYRDMGFFRSHAAPAMHGVAYNVHILRLNGNAGRGERP